MLRLLEDKREYWQAVFECLRLRPKEVMISSYGLMTSAKISSPTKITFSPVSKLLNWLDGERIKTRVLIGSTTKSHLGYYRQYKKMYTTIPFKVHPESHVKMVLFKYPKTSPRAIIGSRNLTGSPWWEIDVLFDDKYATDRLAVCFGKMWGQGKIVRAK